MKTPRQFPGKWRITEMEQWDRKYIDMVVPGHFTFGKNGMGEFQFGTVRGEMDCRMEKREGRDRLEFTWEGDEEGHPACGRGWAEVEGKEMKGRLFFHLGDDSGFAARKSK
jgi:uncharacterized protein YndB with AHSA1/START domain